MTLLSYIKCAILVQFGNPSWPTLVDANGTGQISCTKRLNPARMTCYAFKITSNGIQANIYLAIYAPSSLELWQRMKSIKLKWRTRATFSPQSQIQSPDLLYRSVHRPIRLHNLALSIELHQRIAFITFAFSCVFTLQYNYGCKK